MKKINLNNLYIKLILLFPIFTLFQSFPGLSLINKFLFFLAIFIQLLLQLKNPYIKKKWVIVLMFLFIVHIYAFFKTSFPLYNMNMLFYFGFWILYLIYYIDNEDNITDMLKNNISYIKSIIIIWSLIVGLSIFIPSSYIRYSAWGNAKYFVSITGSTFRIVPTALMISTLVLLYYCYTKNKKTILYMIIPFYCFLMCGSRTYLGVGILILMIYWYIYNNNKKRFYISLLPIMILLVYFIINSATIDKITATSYNSKSYFDYWGTITNGRSIFWKIDIEYFFKENLLNKFFGCGFNFAYEITEKYYTAAHWAHNDFISILLNFGFVGLAIYFYSMFLLLKQYIKKCNYSIILYLMVVNVWFINAMFNMFYTYTCSMLCFPMMLVSLKYFFKKKESD